MTTKLLVLYIILHLVILFHLLFAITNEGPYFGVCSRHINACYYSDTNIIEQFRG